MKKLTNLCLSPGLIAPSAGPQAAPGDGRQAAEGVPTTGEEASPSGTPEQGESAGAPASVEAKAQPLAASAQQVDLKKADPSVVEPAAASVGESPALDSASARAEGDPDAIFLAFRSLLLKTGTLVGASAIALVRSIAGFVVKGATERAFDEYAEMKPRTSSNLAFTVGAAPADTTLGPQGTS